MSPVQISYFSDVLCVWAYAGHRRVEELVHQFGEQVTIETHYCSVFPDAHSKIEDKWATRDTYAGFNAHTLEVAKTFPHVTIHPDIWTSTRPRTSSSAHLWLKAVELIEDRDLPWLDRLSTRAAWAVREAFFKEARDISDWAVLGAIMTGLGADTQALRAVIEDSRAVTALAADYHLCHESGVTGSPTLRLNGGRQVLFGNVGYKLIEANVQELLRTHGKQDASWC